MTVLRSGAASDVGRVRAGNEDRALASPTLFAVADGMGGHVGGEVAARTAIETLEARYNRSPTASGLLAAIVAANDAVWQRGQTDRDLRGMGTTLTTTALVTASSGDDVLVLANVGDSRAYLFAEGQIVQLTADHSLAEEKVRLGEMTEAEAAVHPHRHILTRAIGVGPGVLPDLWELHVQSGDRLLLCSDGLSNEVGAEELAAILAGEPDPGAAAQQLVDAANANGGNDNITAVVIDVVVGEERPRGIAVLPIDGHPLAPPHPDGVGAPEDEVTGVDRLPTPVTSGPGPTGTDQGERTEEAGVAGVGPDPVTGMIPAVAAAPLPDDATLLPTDVPVATAVEAPPTISGRRRARTRRQPRPITIRVALFILLLAGVVIGAYYLVRWYATDAYYVTIDGGHLAVYQGRPGGVLGFDPKLVDRSSVTTGQVLPSRVSELRSTVNEPSEQAARQFIRDLRQEKLDQQQTLPGGGSGAVFGTTTTTTTTVPGTTTTTPPGTTLP